MNSKKIIHHESLSTFGSRRLPIRLIHNANCRIISKFIIVIPQANSRKYEITEKGRKLF